jgi:hypothetical protein
MQAMRLVAFAAVVVVALAAAGQASPSRTVYLAFKAPSGNIGCAYSAQENGFGNMRCEIASGLKPLPPRRCPHGGEWGRAVQMASRSVSTRICVTDTVLDPRAPVLGYGKTWRRGVFTCVSRKAGLTCSNGVKHGWFLSRAKSRLF